MITIPIQPIIDNPDRFKPIYIVAKGLLLSDNRPSEYEMLAFDILDKLSKEAMDLLDPGVTIAGGCIRSIIDGTKMKDVDIYFDNMTAFFYVVRTKLKWDGSIGLYTYQDTNMLKTKFPLNHNIGADLIAYPHCQSIQDLFDQFDFECCKWAIDYQNIYINSDKTISDTKDKICSTDKPISEYRKIQYESKGYKFLVPPVIKEHQSKTLVDVIF